MKLSRTFFDTLIVTYLLMTAAAFYLTMTHRFPENFLRLPLHYVYGMMAPYQGASPLNRELVLVGYDERGVATVIDMDRYFPGLKGERNARQMLDQIADRSTETLRTYYLLYLQDIDAHLQDEGRAFLSYALWRETWAQSPEGYGVGRTTATRDLLVRYP